MRIVATPTGSTQGDILDWQLAIQDTYVKPIENAAYGALKDVADLTQVRARRSIASGGFGLKWQNALKVKVYPTKPSLSAAAYVYSKIPYAGIFESGGPVAGRPMMWLPTKYTPVGRDGPMRPSQFARRFGKLRGSRRGTRGNKTPLLFGKVGGKSVPVYVGVKIVQHTKKFDVAGAVLSSINEFEHFYQLRLEELR